MPPLPANACDCHVHVFGPAGRYAFDPGRIYTPGDAPVAALDALHRRLGIARVVLVQPSVYGADNSRLIDALGELGPRARAVAVIDEATGDTDLAALDAAGVRGVRVNIATHGMHEPAEALRLLRWNAARVAPLGWHVQVLTRPAVIAALGPALADLPTPLVVDHFGLPDLAAGPGQPGFAALCDLVRTGRVLVKLSAIERQTGAGGGARLAPFIRALLAANPAALVWGSDWPHTGGGRGQGRGRDAIEPFEPLDDADALAALSAGIDHPADLAAVLSQTPARLYGF